MNTVRMPPTLVGVFAALAGVFAEGVFVAGEAGVSAAAAARAANRTESSMSLLVSVLDTVLDTVLSLATFTWPPPSRFRSSW